MWLQTRMFLLTAALFAILYGVITAVGYYLGSGSAWIYLVMAFVFLGIQYLVSPYIVGWIMGIKWVSEKEEPELHRMVADLAKKAKLPKPKVGISKLSIPNAFAFGRTKRDGRICVTKGILSILNKEELEAVLGHEMAHIQHRDMIVITLLSVIPLVMYWIAWSTMWAGMGRRQRGGYAIIIGILAFMAYFVTNLLVLYGSYGNSFIQIGTE
ncbi:MAG: M48 family metalloprotease [Chloroflexi bacterium]|nr:M48 family metalloprotease [Chloroflexota bacterium]